MPAGMYILNLRGEPVPCDSLMEWAEWFEHADRRVAFDKVGTSEISTVFLGLDHNFGDGPPLLWETMIFRGREWSDLTQRFYPKEVDCRRHASRADALDYHEQCVAKLTLAFRLMQEN